MEEQSHAWNIAIGIYMVLGGAAICKVIIDIAISWNKIPEQEQFKFRSHEPHDTMFEDEMYHHGYVFCNVFKTSEIIAIANKIGVSLSKQDVITVVGAIKKDFTIAVGIDRYRIEQYIRIHIKHNIQKQ